MKRVVQTAAVTLVVALLIGAAAKVQQARESRYPQPTVDEATLYFTSGATLSRLTKGYHALAADLYWIRAIQYYGGQKIALEAAPPVPAALAPEGYPLLYPLLDITTSLDAGFNIAYRFGAVFLAENYPTGAARPDLAIALLEKGLKSRPDKWEYMQDIGFVHYWWRHDYKAAAEWFNRGASVAGAPWFLRSLAATTLAEGGDPQSSRTMWQSIRDTAEIDWLRGEAERRLLQLDALDAIRALQERVDLVATRSGAIPESWDTVVRAGALPGVPLDPTRVPFVLDHGKVNVSSGSRLYPLPDEPHRLSQAPS